MPRWGILSKPAVAFEAIQIQQATLFTKREVVFSPDGNELRCCEDGSWLCSKWMRWTKPERRSQQERRPEKQSGKPSLVKD